MYGGAENFSGFATFGQFLDLFAVEEKEVGNTAGEVGLNGFIPMFGENVIE